MKRLLILVVALALPFSARAGQITLNAGESALFNFDLTGVMPAPSYDFVSGRTPLISADPNTFQTTFFAGLDGTGGVAAGLDIDFFVFHYTFADPAFTDGLYSVLYQAANDAVTFDNPFVVGHFDGLQTSAVFGIKQMASVPEPASLALLGLAVAAVGLRRKVR